jgi:large subunit ribosomal protein L13
MTHLRIYTAGEHPHAAQAPEVVEFASLNSKNVRSQ